MNLAKIDNDFSGNLCVTTIVFASALKPISTSETKSKSLISPNTPLTNQAAFSFSETRTRFCSACLIVVPGTFARKLTSYASLRTNSTRYMDSCQTTTKSPA